MKKHLCAALSLLLVCVLLGAILPAPRAHAADIPCGVATGAPEQNITFILDGLDLRRDFRCVVDPTQYSHSKPAPDCYLRAAALLGVAPANCTVFEDAVAGIQAAHAGGMKAVGVGDPDIVTGCDRFAKTLADIAVEQVEDLFDSEIIDNR